MLITAIVMIVKGGPLKLTNKGDRIMSKYRVMKEYRMLTDKILYRVDKKGWFFWYFVTFKNTQGEADNLIKRLIDAGL